MSQHHVFMAEALRLAEKGRMTTHPNPMVGCVLVQNNEIIARGFHRQAGEAHAEIEAIQQARTNNLDIKGATAYVSLEPCAHQGRTGPCCEALLNAQVARVVVAMQDPNPQVAGKGIAYLKQHGVEVIEGVLEAQALELNRAFIKTMKTGLPFVQLKIAASMDGRTAMASGESQWITDAAAREDVQLLRAQAGAVITGSGTFYYDNPALTVRPESWQLHKYPSHSDSKIRQPIRVVVSSKAPNATLLNTPDTATLLHDGYDSIWASLEVCDHLPRSEAVQYWCVPESENNAQQVDLKHLLQRLVSEHEVRSVLVEAGAELAGAFIEAGLVDEIIMYYAPTLMGNEARGMFALPFTEMKERLALSIKSVRQVGETVRISAQLA